MAAKAIMVQGTGSHVGKSVIVAALCRILKRRGIRVAPFKAQNMALNSFITADGGEIGRAQAYQAEAAGVPPSVLMNPVLLKANSDTGAQVIVKGKVVGNMAVRQYHAFKDKAFAAASECYHELAGQYDVIVIEGAGSPAEINLKDSDFVNMKTAQMANAPVLIAADIDKGGVFASIVGTMEILEPAEREMVAGFIINKFRGDPTLLDGGIAYISKRTGRPVLGVIPYFSGIHIQEEDGVALTPDAGRAAPEDGAVDVAVLRLGHISNFTDFDPLAGEDGVRLRYVREAEDFGRPDILIIPGSKNTIGDLLEIRKSGLERAVMSYHASGGMVVGICGGFQMMGTAIRDPHGVESGAGEVEGMGLLDAETTLSLEKITAQVEAREKSGNGLYNGQAMLKGYEIHMGITTLGRGAAPMFTVTRKNGDNTSYDDGAGRPDGSAWGTYMHGIFENDDFRRGLLRQLRAGKKSPDSHVLLDYKKLKEEGFESLADHVSKNLDMPAVMRLMGMV